MKKYILVLLIAIAAAAPFFVFKDIWPWRQVMQISGKPPAALKANPCRKKMLEYLKLRKDKLAIAQADKILVADPQDLCAWWTRAEIMRRNSRFKEAEDLLQQILSQYPKHIPSLISLAYIKYNDNQLEEASRILKEVLSLNDLDKEDQALAYMLIGGINAKKALGGLFSELAYGLKIRGYLEKAKFLAPNLAEVRLGLGMYYLLAPSVVGGNVDKAISELEYAVKLTPDFATANARLAQAYKKKGNLAKYNFYFRRAMVLEPKNEVLKDME